MSKAEKRLEDLLKFPPEMRFEDVRAILEEQGFMITQGKGSHNRFSKSGEQPIDVPIVNGRFVKRTYLKLIVKRLDLEKK
jgi:predicted RNA binding protein YcfA (HicA-like mRNA interferase family)